MLSCLLLLFTFMSLSSGKTKKEKYVTVYFTRDALLAWYMLPPYVCLSVRLSGTSRCSSSVGSHKQRHTIAQGLSLYGAIDLGEFPMGLPPTRARNAGGACKNSVFRPKEKSPTQKPYRREFASIRHGGLRRQ